VGASVNWFLSAWKEGPRHTQAAPGPSSFWVGMSRCSSSFHRLAVGGMLTPPEEKVLES
jgi:hypothetical protein